MSLKGAILFILHLKSRMWVLTRNFSLFFFALSIYYSPGANIGIAR